MSEIKKYRPSNGSEGEMFCREYCDCCSNKYGPVNCRIELSTMAFGINEPEYPKEWIYDENGKPKCTKWSKKWKN